MKLVIAGVLCFFSFFGCWGQDQLTISGYIKDADNGEALIGATVYISEISSGTTSNAYGFYSITLPKGIYNLQVKNFLLLPEK